MRQKGRSTQNLLVARNAKVTAVAAYHLLVWRRGLMKRMTLRGSCTSRR
jgi:hypothetical protein